MLTNTFKATVVIKIIPRVLRTKRAHLQEFQQVIREQLYLIKLTTLNASEIRNYIYTIINEKPNMYCTRSYYIVGLFY